MPNPKPPYPPEFRAEAIRLARAPGHSVRQVARDLGIANESLRRWIIEADIERGDAPGLTTDERAELTRLRRENRTLRIEREILK
jgi:transposase